jgi:hypothetical protein
VNIDDAVERRAAFRFRAASADQVIRHFAESKPENRLSYFTFLIHARTGPDTVLSAVSREKTSDIWLSPFSYNMVGQCAGPSLHSSSCRVW